MRCALVTGGARGIGRAVCDMLSRKGYSLAIGYNGSGKAAEAMVNEYQNRGINCIAVRADLSKVDGAEKLLDELKGFPSVDTLINNAGVSSFSLLQDVSEQEVSRVMNVNFYSPMKLIRALCKNMVSRGFGRIVNITSMWALVGSAGESLYSASKAALSGLSKSLAKELGRCNVTVNCVAPGLIDTDMNSDVDRDSLQEITSATPLNRIGRADEVAAAVSLLIEENSFINGETINVSGGLVIT